MIGDFLNITFGVGTGFAICQSILRYFRRMQNKEDIVMSDDEEHENFSIEEEYYSDYDEDIIAQSPFQVSPEEACGVFLIRKDLKMGRGKEAAQFGHAILGLFYDISEVDHRFCSQWYDNSFPKYFFYVEDEEHMDKYREMAVSENFCACKIRDAGRTQIAAGSATVLGIGPVPIESVNLLFGGLTPIK